MLARVLNLPAGQTSGRICSVLGREWLSQTRERCVLRGGLKGKGFMGPDGSVVKDAKPPGWKLGAITVEVKRELSF